MMGDGFEILVALRYFSTGGSRTIREPSLLIT